ncbi:MAG: hydrogenase expression/formation protein HypE [candidate division Zixibacteria bacterium]|nr:hydrogenase expression/formation protein HypE [candidate division Zixibacteria bacterium]
MHQLIDRIFKQAFRNLGLETQHDGAVINPGNGKLAFTTDSFVVQPLFFPGGDIGTLAVNGTVNDLAMCGAKPLYLSVGFILEEGLLIEDLWKIAISMRDAAVKAGIKIVTGDTKVVDKGKGDGVFINTSGVGILKHDLSIMPSSIKNGDLIILNGDIGRHGLAVMLKRNDFSFETDIESDCAPLTDIVMKLLNAGVEIHCMRDLTRGGLASALVEIAQTSKLHLSIDENAIPIRNDVASACELLGFDPIYIANEGKFIAFIPEKDAQAALDIIHSEISMSEACIIGKAINENSDLVTIKGKFGTERIIEMLSGEQFPRIC